MKIAIINATCGFGSTGKIAVALYDMFQKYGHSAKVFYGIERVVTQENAVNNPDFFFFGNKNILKVDRVFGAILGRSGELSFIPTKKLLRGLTDFKPDIVWLLNIHGSFVHEFMLLNYLKDNKIWTYYSMIDEYAYLGKCCNEIDCDKYKYERGCYECTHLKNSPRSIFFDNSHRKFIKKKKVYEGFDQLIFGSVPFVVDKARHSFLLKDREVWTADEAVDMTKVYYPRSTERLREELKIGDKRVVLLCASITSPVKGTHFFLEAAQKLLDEDIVFLNVSFGGDESLCPENYIPLPYETDINHMAEYYSLADAYVCTSISDTQPNACLEAMGCGTPIIGFNISGVPYIAPNEFGTFVDEISADALASAIKNVKKKTPEFSKKVREYAVSRFSNEAAEKRNIEFLAEIQRRKGKC